MHQSSNAQVLPFYVHGTPMARCPFPRRERAFLGQLDNRILNRHTLDLLKGCQASAGPCLISSKLEKTSQTKGFPNSCCWFLALVGLMFCPRYCREHLHSSDWQNLGSGGAILPVVPISDASQRQL